MCIETKNLTYAVDKLSPIRFKVASNALPVAESQFVLANLVSHDCAQSDDRSGHCSEPRQGGTTINAAVVPPQVHDVEKLCS